MKLTKTQRTALEKIAANGDRGLWLDALPIGHKSPPGLQPSTMTSLRKRGLVSVSMSGFIHKLTEKGLQALQPKGRKP